MNAVTVASLVDTDGLIESSVAALIAGAGVTILFALAVYGASRFADARRGGASLGGGAAIGLAVVALVGCAAAVVAGIVIMVADRS
jgi:hypothetical protein